MQELARLSLLIGEENVKLLANKTVLVLGLGGVGGYVVEALVRSGIGHIYLVDYDIIDITNMNRQMIALQSNIGKYKTEVWKERIKNILPTCKVTIKNEKIAEENIALLFQENIDYVIDACDTINTKFALIYECMYHNIPLITCLGTGKRMDPSKLEITDLRKTENDPLARILRKKVKEKKITSKIPVVWSREIPKKTKEKEIASSIFVPASAGILAASYVIKQLLGGKQE